MSSARKAIAAAMTTQSKDCDGPDAGPSVPLPTEEPHSGTHRGGDDRTCQQGAIDPAQSEETNDESGCGTGDGTDDEVMEQPPGPVTWRSADVPQRSPSCADIRAERHAPSDVDPRWSNSDHVVPAGKPDAPPRSEHRTDAGLALDVRRVRIPGGHHEKRHHNQLQQGLHVGYGPRPHDSHVVRPDRTCLARVGGAGYTSASPSGMTVVA